MVLDVFWMIVDLFLMQDKEIEMEDLEEDIIVDIDSPDKNDALAVVEYVNDIYAYYKKMEVRYFLSILLQFQAFTLMIGPMSTFN